MKLTLPFCHRISSVHSIGGAQTVPAPSGGAFPLISTLLAVFCLSTLALAQAPPPDQVYAIDPKVIHPPVPVNVPEAEMPYGLTHSQMSGLCIVKLIVDPKGLPQQPTIVRCTDSIFAANSLKAIKGYRFKPATTIQGDKPVPVPMTIQVSFRRNGGDLPPLPRPHIRVGFLVPVEHATAEPDSAGVYSLSPAFDPPNSFPRMQRFVGVKFTRAAFSLEDGVGCTADLTIDATGHLTNGHITKCDHPGLSESALESLLKSDFAPAVLNGKPVPVHATVHLVCEGFDTSPSDSH